MKTHKDLKVWKESIALVTVIYKHTEGFPKSELYGLTNQIRRSSVSISSNISEGAARHSQKEFIHFLYIALGSSSELETQLIIAENLGFIEKTANEMLMTKLKSISKMLHGLIKHVKGNID